MWLSTPEVSLQEVKSSWDAVGRIEKLLDDQASILQRLGQKPFSAACHTDSQDCYIMIALKLLVRLYSAGPDRRGLGQPKPAAS